MSESDALELLVSNTRIHTKSDPYFAKIAAQVLYKEVVLLLMLLLVVILLQILNQLHLLNM